MSVLRVCALALVTAVMASCAPRDGGAGNAAVPDSFTVSLETSKGEVRIRFHSAWAPIGVARVHELVSDGFYEGARIYRVNPRYAQFGYTGRPEVDSVWVSAGMPDEPAVASNVRGSVSFARGGPGTRSVILFVNRGDNSDLDALEWNGVTGFTPVGMVVEGMEAIDALEGRYGDAPLQWEESIAAVGNDFLDRTFPGLDSISSVRIVEQWR